MSAFALGALSHAFGAGAFLILGLLLLTAWRGRIEGGLLLAAIGISALWMAVVVVYLRVGSPPFSALELLEILRDAAWFTFLLKLLGYARAERSRTVRIYAVVSLGLCAVVAAVVILNRYTTELLVDQGATRGLIIFGHLLLAIFGLALVEQLYRNTRPERRWEVKFLCFGVGGLFAYDLYLYSNAMLFNQLDPLSWHARGFVNAFAVPLLALAAKRNPRWSLDIFVSRHVVFHSAALFGAGAYLLLMAAAGYYIRIFGGSWGGIAQITFLFGALMLLIALTVSGRVRSRLRVFLVKHFYRNRYDYREEWLRFTYTLSASSGGDALKEDIVRAIARIVESPGGILWLRRGEAGFRPLAQWHATPPDRAVLDADASLARFLVKQGWVVFVDEYRSTRHRYPKLELPDWFDELRRPWAIVPLLHAERLVGFIVLTRSNTKPGLNWEDADLLKTVGRQAASYLALLDATEALTEARQFEAFNRLSAYVVHDLKNLSAQLSLVVSNSERHLHSPGFVEDAIATVANACAKMNRLLGQLRKGRLEEGAIHGVMLADVVRDALRTRAAEQPVPRLGAVTPGVRVRAERDRLTSVVEHLVQNAQEATPADGRVELRVAMEGRWGVIEIADTGTGMDETFVAERLFRPFDTTKGNAGMGVGVYESREFVQSLGGELRVRSKAGQGTTFQVCLPMDDANMAAALNGPTTEAAN